MFRLNEKSEKEQIEIVTNHPMDLSFIINPSVKVQLAAVQSNGYAIKFLNNPCLEVQLAAVKSNGTVIQFINNPCLEVQLEAVRQYGINIYYITDPCLEVQLEALMNEGPSSKINIEKILEMVEIIPQPLFKHLYQNHYPFKEKFKETTKYKQALIEFNV